MPNNESTILDMTHDLLTSTLRLEQENKLEHSLRELKDRVFKRLADDPVNTIGVAFSLGFTAMKLLESPKVEIRKQLLKAAGVALIYGFISPIIQSETVNRGKELH